MRELFRWSLWLGIYIGLTMEEQKFAIEPQDQTAIVGSKVTLPCRVINQSGSLQWTKDNFALGNHRNLSEYGRYMMIGSDEEGDFSLAIDPVTLDDNARYQCQVGPGKNGDAGIRSRYAHLSILVPPNRPEIVQGPLLTTTEDREIELECVSRGGKPAAEIFWLDGLGNVVTPNAEYRTESVPGSQLITARSILKVTPKKEHHNTTFVCQAQNEAERTYQSARLRLMVKYAPKVSVKINPGSNNNWYNQLIEGMDVKISCSADANPPEVNYRWYLNDVAIFPESPTTLILSNISRTNHESIVKCEAYNTVGKSEDSETLHVIYAPRFTHRPQSIQAEYGAQVMLTCEVDGNPPPEITWVQAPFNKVVGKSSNLSVTVSELSAGKYYCKALTSGFAEISSEAWVYMKGRPIIKKQPVQFGIVGDDIRLECIAYSIPVPDKIIWSYAGRMIGVENQLEYTVTDESISDGIRTTLLIRESKTEHFGTYNCTVSNNYGSDTSEIVLKPQKTFPLMFALIVILISVFVVVAVILVTILCQRKEKQKGPPPPPAIVIDSEKQCKDSDRSSNISDLKLEIRTGSSASNTNCDDYGSGNGQDTDSIITRVAMPLSNSLNLDSKYSINRFSSTDYPDPLFPLKPDGHNNNGYIPYVDYSRDYNPPVSHSSLNLTNGGPSHAEIRYGSNYSASYVRNLPNGQPPPPPYCTIRNGTIPQKNSQYIVANNSQPMVKKGSLATHV